MKTAIFILLTLTLLSSCISDFINSNKTLKGNGVIIEKVINPEKFRSIINSSTFDIIMMQEQRHEIKIVTDENIMPHIITEINNTSVKFYNTNEYNLQPTKVKIYISSEKLELLENSGTGDFNTEYLKTSRGFSILNSGTGDVNVSVIEGVSATFKNTGTGNILMKGTISNIDILNSGTGTIKFEELKSEITNLTNSGTGDAFINAYSKISAKNSGTGDLFYYGNPSEAELSNTGTGEIRKK